MSAIQTETIKRPEKHILFIEDLSENVYPPKNVIFIKSYKKSSNYVIGLPA